ncbi:hypothetical protein Bbelb_015770 [Branchiostoma belcheri]|nr:hypothetical protein Bbelb_015770 [Branchiostoma belcheri]
MDVRLLNSPHPQPHEQQDFQAAAPPGGMHQNFTHYFGTCVCTNLCSIARLIALLAVVDPKWDRSPASRRRSQWNPGKNITSRKVYLQLKNTERAVACMRSAEDSFPEHGPREGSISFL